MAAQSTNSSLAPRPGDFKGIICSWGVNLWRSSYSVRMKKVIFVVRKFCKTSKINGGPHFLKVSFRTPHKLSQSMEKKLHILNFPRWTDCRPSFSFIPMPQGEGEATRGLCQVGSRETLAQKIGSSRLKNITKMISYLEVEKRDQSKFIKKSKGGNMGWWWRPVS